MVRYQRRPEVVDAFVWTGDEDQEEDPKWLVDALERGDARIEDGDHIHFDFSCHPAGNPTAFSGEHVVRHEDGRLSGMRPEQFEAMYETMEDEPLYRAYSSRVPDASGGNEK